MQHCDLRRRARALRLNDTQIATLSGLHRLTVARVLSGSSRVLKETEARIAAVLEAQEQELLSALQPIAAASPGTEETAAVLLPRARVLPALPAGGADRQEEA